MFALWSPTGKRGLSAQADTMIKTPEFPEFDMINTRNSLNSRLISISCSEPHCPFAPTLPQ